MVFETSLETVIAICGAVIVLQGMIALGVSTRIASRARNWLLAAHVALFVAALAPLVADRLPFALAACLALGGKLAGIVFGFAAVTETVEAPFPRHLLFGGTATALAVEVVLATMMIDVTTLMVVSSLVNGLVAALLGAWILRVPWRTDQVAALFLALPFALIATAFLGRLAAAAISPSTETYLASTAIVVLALTGAAFTLVFAILHWHERRMGDALERARDAANSANIAKTEFLRALGHELRTPLTAVVGLSELMRQGDEPALDPFRRDAIDRIHAAGTHMSDMIDDLLDIAMIEAGQQALDARPVALAELVDAAVAMVAPGAADRGIAIETGPGVPDAARLARLVPARSERPAPLPAPGADDTASLLDRHVEVDRRRIVQTLINLLSNAVKFSPEGAVVRLSLLADGAGIAIAIDDDGPGMTPEEIDEAMRVFGRPGRVRQPHVPGHGLGLPLCQELMAAHGGALVILSAPALGTRALMRLPADRLLPEGAGGHAPGEAMRAARATAAE